jgi:putative two-component system response regulator
MTYSPDILNGKILIVDDQEVNVILLGDGRTQPEHFDPVILAMFEKNHLLFDDIFEAYTAKLNW